MRPKLLEIEGLQSFKSNQRIDFEQLGETGLFGIFGPTGSGKSTVLDAITLALYGRVKRAERGTQGIINTNLDSARVAFTFEMLQGNQRKSYRVERSFQRKKGSENLCEPKVVRLTELTGAGEIPLCDKTTEVTNAIERLLGLNHDDFTRAVVLPQNSFHEFLFLESAKKREMLERIFYLEEYGKQLLDKLSRKMAGMKSNLDLLWGELAGYADATDEALAISREEMETAGAERIRAEKEAKLLEERHQQAKEVWQYTQELAQILMQEQLHTLGEKETEEKRILLDKAIKTKGLAERIHNTEELGSYLKKTEIELEELLHALPDTEQNLKLLRDRYEKLKGEASIEQPRLIGLKTRLSDTLILRSEVGAADEKLLELEKSAEKLALNITMDNSEYNRQKGDLETLNQGIGQQQRELASLQVMPEYREQILLGVRLEGEVQVKKASCTELEGRVAGLNTTISHLEQDLMVTRERLARHQEELAALNLKKQQHEASMPEGRNELESYKDQINNIKNVLQVLNIRQALLNQADEKVTKLEFSSQRLIKDADEMQQLWENNKKTLDRDKLEVENLVREFEKNTAFMLSRHLQEGEPCPVCGSPHHPFPALHADEGGAAGLEEKVETARKKLETSEKALKESEGSLLILEERVAALMLQKDQAVLDRDMLLKHMNLEKDKLEQEYRSMDLEQIARQLEGMNACYLDKQKAIAEWEKKKDELQARLLETTEMLNREGLQENKLTAELKVNRDNLKQFADSLQAAKVEQADKEKEYSASLRSLGITAASTEQRRLTDNDKKAEILQKRLEQNQAYFEKNRTALEQLREAIQTQKDALVKLRLEIGSMDAQKAEKEARIRQLAGNSGIEEQLKHTDWKLAEYDRLERQYRESLSELEKQMNSLLSRKSTLENQQTIYSDNLAQAEKMLSDALAEKGFQSKQEAMLAFIPEEKQQVLNAEIHDYDQKALRIKAEKELVIKKMKSRTITEAEWIELEGLYQQTTAWKEACAAKSEVARTGFEQTKARHERWMELSSKHTVLSGRFDLYQQILKLLKAERSKDNSFIDYIAEERLRFVAARASQLLGLMTKYKYELELDTNAGFIIRDNANGGAHRMATSLSGGETFLTALSLALALSEQIQLKGQSPLEFFFLDEGFGTLDNNLLDTVLDSLERLSRKERVIGIISHVPELRYRIGRRLIVTAPAASGEGSQVCIEKA